MDPNKESSSSTLREETNNRFVIEAQEAINLKFGVSSVDDIEGKSQVFHPEFTHQQFGENETIFGYENLKINLFYTPGTLDLYVGIEFDSRIEEDDKDVKADDILRCLNDHMPEDFRFETNLNNFCKLFDAQSSFVPEGRLVHSYKKTAGDGQEKLFEIYVVDEPSEKFKTYVGRMQTFAMWFVDAASYIDTQDHRWKYFVLYERSGKSSDARYSFGGYASIYQYYAYPEHIRPRIAQLLVLPPYQRAGHGVVMLQTIYNNLVPDSRVIDITAEDPSDNFARLRDYVDSLNCQQLSSFAPQSLKEGFSQAMAEESRKQLKIPKIQARRVYEILRFKHTDTSDPLEVKKYRLDVKKRLNAPFKKDQRDWNKLQRALDQEELTQVAAAIRPEQRMQQLQKMYEQTVEEYRYTINRLATHRGAPVRLTNGVH